MDAYEAGRRIREQGEAALRAQDRMVEWLREFREGLSDEDGKRDDPDTRRVPWMDTGQGEPADRPAFADVRVARALERLVELHADAESDTLAMAWREAWDEAYNALGLPCPDRGRAGTKPVAVILDEAAGWARAREERVQANRERADFPMDQETYDREIAAGRSRYVARARAKAAAVRRQGRA